MGRENHKMKALSLLRSRICDPKFIFKPLHDSPDSNYRSCSLLISVWFLGNVFLLRLIDWELNQVAYKLTCYWFAANWNSWYHVLLLRHAITLFCFLVPVARGNLRFVDKSLGSSSDVGFLHIGLQFKVTSALILLLLLGFGACYWRFIGGISRHDFSGMVEFLFALFWK